MGAIGAWKTGHSRFVADVRSRFMMDIVAPVHG
jgi:hypothetical protein